MRDPSYTGLKSSKISSGVRSSNQSPDIFTKYNEIYLRFICVVYYMVLYMYSTTIRYDRFDWKRCIWMSYVSYLYCILFYIFPNRETLYNALFSNIASLLLYICMFSSMHDYKQSILKKLFVVLLPLCISAYFISLSKGFMHFHGIQTCVTVLLIIFYYVCHESLY